MKLGFIGLGQMGFGMCRNLVRGGHPVVASDIRQDAFPDLEAAGVRTSLRAADAAEGADVLFLCLIDEQVVRAVLFGPEGVARRMKPGGVVVDCSTIGYRDALELAGEAAAHGLRFVDAPVSGMQARAEDGTLTIMCGGDPDAFELVRPLLECMGSQVLYMGAAGSGQLTKMFNNCLYNANVAALSEVLALAVRMGLRPEQIGRVVNEGTGSSYASQYFIPRMLRGDFRYGFTMRSAYKDMLHFAEDAAEAAAPTPMLDATGTVYRSALCRGHGESYKGAMIRVYEELLGVEFRAQDH